MSNCKFYGKFVYILQIQKNLHRLTSFLMVFDTIRTYNNDYLGLGGARSYSFAHTLGTSTGSGPCIRTNFNLISTTSPAASSHKLVYQ